MTQAEQFKLVAAILKTAEPGSQERLVLGRKIKALLSRVDGDDTHAHLKALLDFRNGVDNYWKEQFKEAA
jgi:hypothetical protein